MSPVVPLPGASDPGPRRLEGSLDRLMGSYGAPPAAVLTTVFASWSDLVGESLAAHTTPRSLRRGVLVVAVDDPAWATQLRWLEADLMARLREVAGEGAVTAIEVRVRV